MLKVNATQHLSFIERGGGKLELMLNIIDFKGGKFSL